MEAREQARTEVETPSTPKIALPFVTAAVESAAPSPTTVLDPNKTPAASPEVKADAPGEGSLAKIAKMMAGGQAGEAEARMRADVEAHIKAVAEQLRIHPADKKAQDAMKQALEQMNRLSEPKPTNVQER